ncbi:unnamed protein product [Amaranthus hypochondriacus]
MSNTSSGESFTIFLQNWLDHQQAYLNQLVEIKYSTETANKQQLIKKLHSHYANYYEEKSKIIWDDTILLFSPPWLTTLEKTFLWVGGFKPTLAFTLLEASVSNMEPSQVEKVQKLKSETIKEEHNLMEALVMVQESMGSRMLSSLDRHGDGLVNGEVSEFDEVMQELKTSMARVIQNADILRRNTMMGMFGILDLDQNLKFLIALLKYQLGVRAYGLQNDAQRG